MHQNRRLLLEGASLAHLDAAIFIEIEQTINLSQIVGRGFDESLSDTLVLTQDLESVKPGIAANTLALTQAVVEDTENPSENDLVLSQVLGHNADYVRSLENTIPLTQSAAGYLANRIPVPVPGVCPEEPLEGFTLEEV